MPAQTGGPSCRAVAHSAPSELAWVLNLLTQTAPYALPATAELDSTLIPGLATMRRPLLDAAAHLWNDGLPGCPELPYLAHLADCLIDEDVRHLFDWLAQPRGRFVERPTPLTESDDDWRAISTRLRRLAERPADRRAYRSMLSQVWDAIAAPWHRQGITVVTEACRTWRAKLDAGDSIEALVPPRHPLTRADELGLVDLFGRRFEFTLSPLYFCMSGGHVVDLVDHVHVAVPASDLLPVRRTRDAMFVAGRLRVLSEATRVRVLLQLLSAPGGAVEIARALGMSQPTVSGHLKVLLQAGLIQRKRIGARSVMVASRKRVERLLEDARATIARWD
ncbi:MAG TPA: winged helix-turn-helix domain-containing protein [Candidatus Dormibacteraeota bacterium]|jgi:DNA-binding transcriptional ArsR family regulator